MSQARLRIGREVQSLNTDPTPGCTAEPVATNVFHWTATITGPPDSPYSGGHFHLTLRLPANYPFAPPRVRFVTPVYHPNISTSGDICVDILSPDRWSPSFSIGKLLLAISSLLCDPNLDHGYRPELIREYRADRMQFNRHATECTRRFASDPIHPGFDSG